MEIIKLNDEFDRWFNSSHNKNPLNYLPTEIKYIDRLIGGFEKGKLILFASAPAMGRTAFVLSLINKLTLEEKVTTAFFNMDNSLKKNGVITRLFKINTKISRFNLASNTIDESEEKRIHQFKEKINLSSLYLDDNCNYSFDKLVTKCRYLVNVMNVKLIFIDSLHLLKKDFKSSLYNSKKETNSFLKLLQKLAFELHVPIIISTSFSLKNCIKNYGKPKMSDLKGYGNFKKYCGSISFIYRPEYYGKLVLKNNKSSHGIGILINVKNNNNCTRNLFLKFDGKLGMYYLK